MSDRWTRTQIRRGLVWAAGGVLVIGAFGYRYYIENESKLDETNDAQKQQLFLSLFNRNGIIKSQIYIKIKI